jgi:FdrA protein
VIVCCLGAAGDAGAPGLWTSTLEDAAEAAVAVARRQPWRPRVFSDPSRVRTCLAGTKARGGLLALYTGGTLAHETRLVLEPLLGPLAGNVGSVSASPHRVVDLGADEFTRGRPHPMIDPSARDARVREAGRTRDVGVILLDLVLGRAAHPDPAGSLAAAIRDARHEAERDGRALLAVASVIGTAHDPQGLAAQIGALEAAGAIVLPSNAQAARFSALALEPALAGTLLNKM